MANDQDLKRNDGNFSTGDGGQFGSEDMNKSDSDSESQYGGDENMGQSGDDSQTDEMIDSDDK